MASIDALIGAFLREARSRGQAAGTTQAHRTSLERLARFLGGQGIEDLGEVTARVLSDYQTYVSLEGDGEERPLSMSTQAHRIGQVRTFFRYLVGRGELLVDPSANLVIPRTVRRPPAHVLDVAAVKRLLLAPDVDMWQGVRDRAILELLYSTGLRVSELVGLNVSDVDLTGRELLVRRGKGGKWRQLPVGEAACLWVGRYLGPVRGRLLVRPGEVALWLSYRGRRMHKNNVEKAIKAYGQAAGIVVRVTPHTLRHTFATHMLRGGASLRHVQEMLGHEQLTTTQIYTKVEISDLKAVHQRCHPRGRG